MFAFPLDLKMINRHFKMFHTLNWQLASGGGGADGFLVGGSSKNCRVCGNTKKKFLPFANVDFEVHKSILQMLHHSVVCVFQ